MEKLNITSFKFPAIGDQFDGSRKEFVIELLRTENQNYVKLVEALTDIITESLYVLGDSDLLGDLTVEGSSDLGGALISDTGNLLLVAGEAPVGKYPIKFQAGVPLTTPETGVLNFYDSRFYITNVATDRAIDRTSGVITSTTEAVNTTVETTLITEYIPANSLRVGNVQKLQICGVISTANAADTCTIRLKAGGITVSSIISPGKNLSDACWEIAACTTIRTLGATGSAATRITMRAEDNTSEVCTDNIVLDTTRALDLTVTVQWSAANVGNSIKISQGWLEYKN